MAEVIELGLFPLLTFPIETAALLSTPRPQVADIWTLLFILGIITMMAIEPRED